VPNTIPVSFPAMTIQADIDLGNSAVRRGRIGVVAPYTDFWEAAVPFSARDALAALLRRATATIAPFADVTLGAIVGSREEGEATGRHLADAGVDVVVVMQAMAVMPAFTLAALAPVADRPLVVWAVNDGEPVSDDYDHAQITMQGGTVGVPMLTSVLVRTGRPFDLVVGPVDGPAATEALRPALAAATAARRLATARIGLVGPPIDGYDCVTADAERLRAQVGTTLVDIAPAELLERYRAVSPARVDALRAETRATYDVAPDVAPDEEHRSLRAACAIEDLVADHRLDAGALNCHVPEIRFGDDIGIAPCFGLGRMTSLGVPWGCAGDRVTPVAMLALKLLGGAAVYHELETFDAHTGELVIANSGEHDLAFAGPERPRIQRNGWFEGDPVCGMCACFGPPAGPATLLAFTQLDVPETRFRFVVGEGTFTTRDVSGVGTANGAFRFDRGSVVDAWTAWCRAGVSHHSAATPGAYGDALARVGAHLGVEVVRV
jgi:L-arabinose isomerase